MGTWENRRWWFGGGGRVQEAGQEKTGGRSSTRVEIGENKRRLRNNA